MGKLRVVLGIVLALATLALAGCVYDDEDHDRPSWDHVGPKPTVHRFGGRRR